MSVAVVATTERAPWDAFGFGSTTLPATACVASVKRTSRHGTVEIGLAIRSCLHSHRTDVNLRLAETQMAKKSQHRTPMTACSWNGMAVAGASSAIGQLLEIGRRCADLVTLASTCSWSDLAPPGSGIAAVRAPAGRRGPAAPPGSGSRPHAHQLVDVGL